MALVAVIAIVLLASVTEAEARRRAKAGSGYSPPQSSLAFDLVSGRIIHSHKADEPRYPASLTKVMTLYVVFEHLRAKRISLTTELLVTENAASQPPTKLYLKAGETITVQDAIRALVTRSANDAAVVLAENLAGSEEAFARIMTARARALGMKNSTFRNASGLPNAEQRTTAFDMATLARRIMADFPEHASLFKLRHFRFKGKVYKNHNSLLFSYFGAEGMKTGFTNASGFNLIATARRDRKHIVAVVLGGQSARSRDNRMRLLLNASWSKATPRPERPAKEEAVAAASAKPKDAPKDRAKLEKPSSEASASPKLRPVVTPPAASAAAATPSFRPPGGAEKIAASVAIPAGRPAFDPSRPEAPGQFHVQVGAYDSRERAEMRLAAIGREASDVLGGHPRFVVMGMSGARPVARARFGAFSEAEATKACEALKARAIDCMVIRYQ